MQYTIDETIGKCQDFKDFHNLPYDLEILNIDDLTLPKGVVFDNLPVGLKEINIKTLWAVHMGGIISCGMFCGYVNLKDFIRKIFPKIPFGCKIYMMDE